MVMGLNLWEEAREYVVSGKQKRKSAREEKKKQKEQKKEQKKECVEPDTSSLTAFLLSLLSFSEPNDVYSEGNTESSDSEVEVASSSSRIISGRSEVQGGKESASVAEPGGSRKDDGKEALPSPVAVGDDCDADWQLVSETDLLSSKLFTELPTAIFGKKKPEPKVPALVRLPSMYEVSSLLSENLRSAIYGYLPNLAKGRQWVLLYSTNKHGISLRTLYRKAGLVPGPCLLVAGDRLGAIFGGLLSSPLKPALKKKYQGTSDSFVFTNVGGSPQVFRPTGLNRYYVLCTNESLAFGGGGHFALHLDSELLYGSSAACETYGNAGLATTEDFVLKDVELWGFAHASKYNPVESSQRDPGVLGGIYSW